MRRNESLILLSLLNKLNNNSTGDKKNYHPYKSTEGADICPTLLEKGLDTLSTTILNEITESISGVELYTT